MPPPPGIPLIFNGYSGTASKLSSVSYNKVNMTAPRHKDVTGVQGRLPPRILNFGTSVVSFMSRPLYPQGKGHPGTQWIGRCADPPTTCLDSGANRKIPASARIESRSSL